MSNVNSRAKKGIQLLLGRQVAVQVLTFAGGIFLARILGPSQFGLYIISLFLVGTFALIGDFGLSASFLQRKNELSDRDLQVAFTLQQILTSLVVLILVIAAPLLVHLYPKAPPQTVWLVRALAFNLFLTSWRTMSAIQLERHLHFSQLARVEVVESLSFQAIAVGMAFAGMGVWSYVVAALVQGLLGTVLVYRAAPWPIRFTFDKTIALEILRYGLPFQLQTIVNSVGGWVTPLLVGSLIGPVGVGYLTWASSNGKKPMILTDIVMRVAFPHFSRLQDDPEAVERILIRYLTLLLIPACLWFSILLTAGPFLVHWIYTVKWMPAVPALIIFAGSITFDMIGMVLGMTLNGLGRVHATTQIVLVRNILNVVLAIIFVPRFGLIAVPTAFLISSCLTAPWMLYCLGRHTFLRILRAISWLLVPLFSSILAGEFAFKLSSSLMLQSISIVIMVLACYIAVAFLVGPAWLKSSILTKLQRRNGQTVALAAGISD